MTVPMHIDVGVEIGGTALTAAALHALSCLAVRQALSAPAAIELVFAEPPDDIAIACKLGVVIRVTLAGKALFDGEITALVHERRGAQNRALRVRGHDKLHRLNKRQALRAFADRSFADIAKTIVEDLNLKCDMDAGPQHALLLQHGISDFQFLQKVALDAGLYLLLEGETLRTVTLAGAGEPVKLGDDNVLFNCTVDIGSERIRRNSQFLALGPVDFDVVKGEASQPRTAQERAPSQFSDLGERIRSQTFVADIETAKAISQSDLDRGAAFGTIATGLVNGNVAIRAGGLIELVGVAADADGRFVVTSVLHSIDAERGFLTEFSSEPPPVPMPGCPPTFAVGQISATNDPEKHGRVRARLPALEGLETGWMQVVTPGAGEDRGIVALPRTDDHVLIAAPDGDLAQALVLGGLFGKRNRPEGSDDNTFILSADKDQMLMVEAGNGRVALRTAGGDSIELGPNGCEFHAAGDLVIEAPGHKLTFRAQSVEFEQG